MNWKTILLGSSATLTACIGLISCEKTSEASSSSANEPVPQQVEVQNQADLPAPDLARLFARASERWDHIAHDDWIQAYDFMPQERKQLEKLSIYLQGKENHEYKDPGKPQLIGLSGADGYLGVEVMWTPHHPEIFAADNAPPDGLSQLLSLVETWIWKDGDWYWSDTVRRNDFFEAHPELAATPKDPSGIDRGEKD